MKLTRQQQVGFAVVALGAGAVLVDQLFIMGPSQASGAPAPAAASPGGSGPGTGAPDRRGPGRMPLTLAATNQPGQLAESLRSIREDLGLTHDDADLGFTTVALDDTLTEEAPEPAASMPSVRITSMLEGQRPLAVINGRAQTIGDTIGAAEIVQIGDGRVVFQVGQELFEVPVERPETP